MALCVKRNDEEFYRRNDLKILDLANLTDCMSKLSAGGYFYSEETVYCGYGKPLWENLSDAATNECTYPSANTYWLTEQWQTAYAQSPVTSIRMTFRHFLTGQEKCLYVKSENPPQGDCTLVWISDDSHEDCNVYRKGTRIKDMPPLFEKLLTANQLILTEGSFKKLDLLSVWPEEIVPDYCFTSLLYRYGYRPLRAAQGTPKVDRHEEQSMAWAGEYKKVNDFDEAPAYYYFFFAKREYQEWESDEYDGTPRCIWSEEDRSFYIAKSQTPLDRVIIHGEPTMILEDIPGIEQIRTYLDQCADLDRAVNLRFDGEDYWM